MGDRVKKLNSLKLKRDENLGYHLILNGQDLRGIRGFKVEIGSHKLSFKGTVTVTLELDELEFEDNYEIIETDFE